MKKVRYEIFPQGKKMCVTFSYDDGKLNDIRLYNLFKKYGLKATFNLNSCNIGRENYITENDVKNMVADGFEIAVHSVAHPLLETLSDQIILNEILEDKRALEKISGKIIFGMAYPMGTYDANVINIAKKCGIKYSRTCKNNGFLMPEDFMEWGSTCHHRNMASFLPLPEQWWHRIFYVWGHSYEFRTEELWTEFEENLKKIAFRDDFWYATNGEIYEYITAQKALIYSADMDMVYNPSAIDVWIKVDEVPVEIKAGQTVSI